MQHLMYILPPCVVWQDSGTELMPTDIKCYQEFGGEKIIFEKEEVTEMKKFGEPGMRLSGNVNIYVHSNCVVCVAN